MARAARASSQRFDDAPGVARDALHDQLRTAKELFVRELSPSTTNPVATLLKSCAALDTLHWFEGAASTSDDAADQALQALDGNGRPGPDAAAVRRAVDACPARLTRVVVGGYDVTSMVRDATVADVVDVVRVDGHVAWAGPLPVGVGAVPPGWLDEPPTPPTPAAALHPLTQQVRSRNSQQRAPRTTRSPPSSSRSSGHAGAHENGAGRASSEMPPPARLATANATRARSTPNACAW